MAYVLATNKTYNSISVCLDALDISYTQNDREVVWLISTDGSSYSLKGRVSLSGGIRMGGNFMFTDIDAGTTYFIKAVVYFSSGAYKTFTGTATTYPSYPTIEVLNTLSGGANVRITGGNADGYILEVQEYETGALRLIDHVDPGITTIRGLEAATKFTVLATGYKYINGDYYGNYTEIAYFTTKPEDFIPKICLESDFDTDHKNCVGRSGGSYKAHFQIFAYYPIIYPYYQYRYKKSGAASWTVSDSNLSTESSSLPELEISGLDICSTYEIQVRQYDGESGYTDWSDTYTFSTGSLEIPGLTFDTDNGKGRLWRIRINKAKFDALDCNSYDYCILIAKYHNGILYDADRYYAADIKEMPLVAVNLYYCVNDEYPTEGAGTYKFVIYEYTIYNGKQYLPLWYHDEYILTTYETTVAESAVPSVPTSLAYTHIKKGLRITWNESENAASYNVILIDCNGLTIQNVSVTGTVYTAENLEYSAIYTVYVSSKSSGQVSSEKATTTAITAPPLPVIGHNVSDSTINITWTTEDMTAAVSYVYINLYKADNLDTPVRTFIGSSISGSTSYENVEDGLYVIKASTAIEYNGEIIQCVDSDGSPATVSAQIEIKTRGFYWTDYTTEMRSGGVVSGVPYAAWNGLCDMVHKRICVGKGKTNSLMPSNSATYASGFGSAAGVSFNTAINTYARIVDNNREITAERFNIINYIISSVSQTGIGYKYKISTMPCPVLAADLITLQNKINDV